VVSPLDANAVGVTGVSALCGAQTAFYVHKERIAKGRGRDTFLAVAVLPAVAGISGKSYAHAHALSEGFRKAMIITACMCTLGGIIAAIGIRNHPAESAPPTECPAATYGALEAPPLSNEA
jgi:hypothetical protein